jgi:hypothetical protein
MLLLNFYTYSIKVDTPTHFCQKVATKITFLFAERKRRESRRQSFKEFNFKREGEDMVVKKR